MIKIYKNLARKMWENGEDVMIIPNHVRPTGILAFWSHRPEGELENGAFDKLCNAIHYYNCSPETGMELAFYAKELS